MRIVRALCAFILLTLAQATASATTVTFAAKQITNWQYKGTTAKLRLTASEPFIDSTGVVVLPGLFKEISCTVAGTTLSIPSFTLPSTEDSNRPSARWSAVFYDSAGVKRDALLSQFRLPATFGANVSWDQIILYNNSALPSLRPEIYNKTEVNLLINTTLASVALASDVLAGRTKLSVAPASPTSPVAVGDNDPRVVAPVCAGSNDTAAFSALITAFGSGSGTIRVPYVSASVRCAVNDLTIPANITLDLTQGSLKINAGQTLTISGPLDAPPDKPVFFNALTSRGVPTPDTADVDVTSGTTIANQGTVLFSGTASPNIIQAKWWDLTGSAGGAIAPGIRAATVSLNGKSGEVRHAGGGYVGAADAITDFLPRKNINIVVVPEGAVLRLGPGTYTGAVPAAWVQLSNNSSLICADNRTTILEENTAARNDLNGREWNIVTNTYNSGTPTPDGLGNGSVGHDMNVQNCQFKGARDTAVSFRTAVTLGNCHHCSYKDNYLNNINSLGLHVGANSTTGADPQGLGRYADDFQVVHNRFFQSNSQNIAVVNGRNVTVDNNHILDPGKSGGGGSTPIDAEPNGPTDQMYNIRITNNTVDAKDSTFVNTCIAVQNGNSLPNFGPVVIAGNTCIGGYLEEYGSDPPASNFGIGIWVKGGGETKDVTVEHNYIRGTSQHGIDVEGRRARVKNNTLVRVGGGGFLGIFIDEEAIESEVSGNSIYCNTATTSNFAPCDARIRTDANNTKIFYNLMTADTGGGALSGVVITAGTTGNHESYNFTDDPDSGWLSGNVPSVISLGELTASAPWASSTATWNSGGTAFTHELHNVTDTASASASLLLDFQVNSVSKFSVRKDGKVTADGSGLTNLNASNISSGTLALARLPTLPLSGIKDAVITGGLVADAALSTDGVTTASSTTFTSASKSCTAGDAGKPIIIYGAGIRLLDGGGVLHNSNYNPLRTTIASCSGSAFVLTNAASASTTGARWVYGTQNTTAFQTLASSLTSGGVIFLPPGNYMLGAVTLLSNTTVLAEPGTVMIYSTANSGITFSNRSNITIDGISIDATGNPSTSGPTSTTYISGNVTMIGGTTVSNVLIRNCKILDTFLQNSGNSVPMDTFNRHGVLLRDGSNWRVLNNDFGPAMRIKAAGTGNTSDVWIENNTFDRTNENGISLLTVGAASVTNRVYIRNNILKGVIESGNQITIGDDGGTNAQTLSNIEITGNILTGPLPSGVSHIQNRGAATQFNISISNNTCDNTASGSVVSTTMCLNIANQLPSGGNAANFTATNNKAYGPYDYAAFRFGNVSSGLISGNIAESLTVNSTRGIRLGAVSNTVVSNNRVAGALYGIYINAGAYDNLTVRDNEIVMVGANNTAGVLLEAMTVDVDILFRGNKLYGSGSAFTAAQGFYDQSNDNGHTDNVKYIDNDVVDLVTTTGTGSFKYKTLPANAVVTEQPPLTVQNLLSSTGQNDSATPDVRGMRMILEAYTTPTTVTALNNASPGVPYTILFTTGNVTLQNNSTIKLAGGANFVATANDSITLVWNGTANVELSRSVN